MTDPNGWASPAAPVPAAPPPAPFGAPPTPPVPPAGAFGPPPPVAPPPGSAPPGAASPGQWAPQPAQGWTPPPKPGLIPLRPLTLGPLLAASFQVMRRNPKPTFGLSLLLSGGVSILALLVSGLILTVALQRVVNAAPGAQDEIIAGALGLSFVSVLIPAAIGIAAFAILQGIISLEVARGTVGEKLRLRGLFRLAKGRIWALIGWSLLVLAAGALGVLFIVLVIVALGIAFGSGGFVVGALFGFVLGAGLLVVGVWLGVKTSLVPSVLMMERLPLRAAIARSWRLTGGFFWRTLGIQLLVAVIVSTATNVVTQPITFLGAIALGLVNPGQNVEAVLTGTAILYLIVLVVSLLASSIGLIVQSSATALIYLDLRMRKEGLDVELVRFVEARQAGDDSVPDPYLQRTGAPMAAAPGSPWS